MLRHQQQPVGLDDREVRLQGNRTENHSVVETDRCFLLSVCVPAWWQLSYSGSLVKWIVNGIQSNSFILSRLNASGMFFNRVQENKHNSMLIVDKDLIFLSEWNMCVRERDRSFFHLETATWEFKFISENYKTITMFLNKSSDQERT